MPAASLSPFAALRHRNFRLFFIGQTVSLVGTWMQGLAQGWLVLLLTDSAFWVGVVGALSALPVLLFSLPAGVLVDRADKRRVVLTCQTLMLAQAVVFTLLVAFGEPRAWHVGLLAFALGCLNAIEIPARQSMIVELVGKDDLTNAIALNSSAFNATRIVGPALAGVVVARLGLEVCFALNVLSYAAPMFTLRRMRTAPPAPRGDTAPLAAGLREGLAYVRGERQVLAMVLATAALSVLAYPYLVLLPVFARDVFEVGPEGLGLMSAAVGVGALLAAFGLAAFAARAQRGRLVVAASTAVGLCVAGFALTPWFGAAVAVLTVAGFAMVLTNAATNTLLQGLVPDALRGRVMALWSLVFVGFAPLGSVQVGALAGAVGPRAAVALGGVAATVAAWWIWRRVAPGMRDVR